MIELFDKEFNAWVLLEEGLGPAEIEPALSAWQQLLPGDTLRGQWPGEVRSV